MNITSIAFKHGEEIPEIYTCLGPNINPPLEIKNVPPGARSLVLIFEDADSGTPRWTHWMLYNIKPAVKNILDNWQVSDAAEALSNNNTYGYEGPCPRYFSGRHHYWFRLYALDIMLPALEKPERKMIESFMLDHIIAEASLLCTCTSKAGL